MILYFGNDLSKNSILNLYCSKFLEFSTLKSASHYKNRILRLLHMIIVFFFNFRKTKIIVIEVFSGSAFYFSCFISILSYFFRIPYILVLHGGDLEKRVIKNPKLSKIIFKNSKINISPSMYLKEKLSDYEINVYYIPNFINYNQIPYLQRNYCRMKLLWVRAFHEIYNPKMAIQVVKILKKNNLDVQLCMVGKDLDGSKSECVNIVNELQLHDNITFMNQLDRMEWINLSQNYDIFINTTRVESFGLSVLEAGASGMPIVTTNVGELKYLYLDEQDVMFVKSDDALAMAKKIEHICENRFLANLLSKNIRLKSSEFNWLNIKPKWEKVLLPL